MANTHLERGIGIHEIYSGELGYKGELIKKVTPVIFWLFFLVGLDQQILLTEK
jgi:hypothetical protein